MAQPWNCCHLFVKSTKQGGILKPKSVIADTPKDWRCALHCLGDRKNCRPNRNFCRPNSGGGMCLPPFAMRFGFYFVRRRMSTFFTQQFTFCTACAMPLGRLPRDFCKRLQNYRSNSFIVVELNLAVFDDSCLQTGSPANRAANAYPFIFLYFTLFTALSSVCTISFSPTNSANRRDTFDLSFSCKLSSWRASPNFAIHQAVLIATQPHTFFRLSA